MKHHLSIFALAALSVVAQPAFALSKAEGSVSGFQITLIDLNLFDGIKPSLTFNDPYDDQAISLFAAVQNKLDYARDGVELPRSSPSNLIGTASAASSLNGVSSSVSMNGHSMSVSTQAEVTADTPNGFGLYYFNAIAQAQPTWIDGTSFTLSANTKAVFTAFTSLKASVDESVQQGFFDSAVAEFRFNGSFYTDEFSDSFDITHTAYAVNYPDEETFGDFVLSDSVSRIVAANLINNSDESVDGLISMSLYSGSYAYQYAPAPIPEPSTFALGLLGLAGLGVAAKRRRRMT